MHQLTIPQRLPVELLLLIFERASDRLSGKVDLDAIVGPAAHVPLVSCALVCRSWSRVAQRVLFRDLVLSRADYAKNGKPAPGIACVLRALMRTLAANHTLAASVDFLHVDVGRPSPAVSVAVQGDVITGAGTPPSLISNCDSHDDDAHLADVAALIALCPRVRHVSITLESTPRLGRRGAVFCDADLERLRAASRSVRHFTYTDFRPLCDTVEPVAANAETDNGSAMASNELLTHFLSVWPQLSLLSVCGTYNDVSDEALAILSTSLRELRGYGAVSLPPVDFPRLERLEWVRLPADKLDSLPTGLQKMTLWQLSEALDLRHLEALRRLVLEVRDDSAWMTLRHLPPGLEQLIISDLQGDVGKDALLKAIQDGRGLSLKCLTLIQRRKHSLRDNLAEGYEDLAKACSKNSICLSFEIETASAPWDVIPRP